MSTTSRAVFVQHAPGSFESLTRDLAAIDRTKRAWKPKAAQPNDVACVCDLLRRARSNGLPAEMQDRIEQLVDQRIPLSGALLAKLEQFVRA